MVGDSETPSDYDEVWEELFDSGILEDLIQKAERENALKRTTQVSQVENLPDSEILEDLIQKAEHQSAVKRATSPVVANFSSPHPSNPSFQPSVPVSNAAQVSGRVHESAFNARSQALNRPRKPPLPSELRGSQGYYQDRYEGIHLSSNLSQLPTQTPGSFRYGTPVNGVLSAPNQLSNGVSGVHRDAGLHAVTEQLAERNGTISVLRSKLQQADSELHDLRKRLAVQASSQHAPQFQQKELERLSLELSFKDQEVLDARRARDEKDDRLRDALASAAALKEELQNLRRSSSIQISALKAAPSYSQEDDDDEMIAACDDRQLEMMHAHAKAQSKKLEQGRETWATPWETERPQHLAAHAAVTAEKSSDATVLKARTVDDGCVSSNQKKTGVLPPQASEPPCIGHTSGGIGASAPAPGSLGLGLGEDIVPRELSQSLHQIWNPRGFHNESASLVSELFAVCRHDLYILLTFEETLKEAVEVQTAPETTGSKSTIGVKRKQGLNSTESWKVQENVGSKLHDALAKVANKIMPSTALLGPLLEYCNCDNVDLVQSALHVLRCILRQDPFCRDKVLARKSPLVEKFSITKHTGVSESFSRLNMKFEGKGWFVPGGDMRQQQQEQMSSLPVFFSPRVFCGLPKLQNESTGASSLRPERVEEIEEARAMQHCDDDIDMASSSNLIPFVDGLLVMAARSPNLGIRFEAAAMMGLLVAHTEPVSERAQFGSLLWYGRLASLLEEPAGETAGVGIQLQAIRSVHLLLHCPILLRVFCSALDASLAGCWCEVRNQGEARPAEEAKANVQSLEMQGKGDSCKVVFDGISSCLDASGSSLQAYALRRDAIRVLAFLASSGDAAVRILLHTPMKLESSSVPLKESNISTDGGNGLQSENAQQEPALGKHSAGTGDITVEAAAARSSVSNGERHCFDVPRKLISLLARELKAEEEAVADLNPAERTVACEEDRSCLIRETVTLFSKLLCNQLHSRQVLNWIIGSKETTRLILGVMDQLIRRGGSRPSSSTDLVELARGLQNKIVPELTPLNVKPS